MGLDNFTSEDTTTTSTSQRQSKSPEPEDNEDEEPFKVVGSGADRKVFETEEGWQDAAQFMREEMDLNPNEVLNMPSSKRHDILHRAILQLDGMEQQPFHPTRDCIVCGVTFTFPRNWNFTKFKGEPCCNDHEIQEVVEAYRDINEIQG